MARRRTLGVEADRLMTDPEVVLDNLLRRAVLMGAGAKGMVVRVEVLIELRSGGVDIVSGALTVAGECIIISAPIPKTSVLV